MLDTYDNARLKLLKPDELSDSLERGSIVFFPESPVQLPSEEDLSFLRQELPKLLRLKNISYHPEVGRIPGLDRDDVELVERVNRILVRVSDNITKFIQKNSTSIDRQLDHWNL